MVWPRCLGPGRLASRYARGLRRAGRRQVPGKPREEFMATCEQGALAPAKPTSPTLPSPTAQALRRLAARTGPSAPVNAPRKPTGGAWLTPRRRRSASPASRRRRRCRRSDRPSRRSGPSRKSGNWAFRPTKAPLERRIPGGEPQQQASTRAVATQAARPGGSPLAGARRVRFDLCRRPADRGRPAVQHAGGG